MGGAPRLKADGGSQLRSHDHIFVRSIPDRDGRRWMPFLLSSRPQSVTSLVPTDRVAEWTSPYRPVPVPIDSGSHGMTHHRHPFLKSPPPPPPHSSPMSHARVAAPMLRCTQTRIPSSRRRFHRPSSGHGRVTGSAGPGMAILDLDVPGPSSASPGPEMRCFLGGTRPELTIPTFPPTPTQILFPPPSLTQTESSRSLTLFPPLYK